MTKDEIVAITADIYALDDDGIDERVSDIENKMMNELGLSEEDTDILVCELLALGCAKMQRLMTTPPWLTAIMKESDERLRNKRNKKGQKDDV